VDKIIIKDIELYGYHGVHIEEKELGQKFLVSVEISMDTRSAAKSDNLHDTINYGEISIRVDKHFRSKKYDLIESAAEELANLILTSYEKADGVKIMVKKPSAPIPLALKYVAVEIEREWNTAYISLGSNLGDRKGNLMSALSEIREAKSMKVTRISEIYETSPVGYLEQDNFLNCAIEIKTLLSPLELIEFMAAVENKLKRERIYKLGPRTIDLDVLIYNDLITCYEDLIIPHPRMHERLFVLEPLCQIAPYLIHPILKKRIIELRDEVSKVHKLI
jgi:dihydroneopterin aldolase/2-amino-4-hydroxy-6-hydroxymethyldihydropteridine diphosphokinase